MQFWKNNLKDIQGIGPKVEEALGRLNIHSSYDLLFHFPSNIIHKRLYPPLYSLEQGELVVLQLKIFAIDQPNNPHNIRRKQFTIYCENNSGKIDLCYFNYYPQYLLNWAKIGSEIIVIGKVDIYNKLKKISHPEVLNPAKLNLKIDKDENVYPLTYGIINKQLQKYIHLAITSLGEIEEWISLDLIKQNGWDSFTNSLKAIHHSTKAEQLTPYCKERQRLAYDELLATQLMVNLLRKYKDEHSGRSIMGARKYLNNFLQTLPFELTKGQKAAIEDILVDQKSSKKMSRLLQGDVGSGKTIVAFAAMLNTVEAGFQAVLMAPTDVLANQHFLTLEKFCKDMPISYALLTGKTKAKERKRIMEDLANGQLQILVGTHAVFQDKVIFHDLALVVIDEQHRFGVEQRLSLLNKGKDADLLIMSATPIPRSLSLAIYGDMEVTQITEKPKNRIAIKTSILPSSKINEITISLEKILNENGKIYWVCPLVSESEDEDSSIKKTSVESRAQELAKNYPAMVGLIHGKLDNNLKQETLNKFIKGDYRILVATTVIEVGVDVPDATVIIIENAETFGLSQLHQLRGRVGRGDKASYCILFYKAPISNVSWQRLKILRETDDGFILAEEDLKLRGSGDIVGTKQSGLPNFKVVDFIAHHQLITIANAQAKQIIKDDPLLTLPSSQKYHHLLSIFGFNYKSLDW